MTRHETDGLYHYTDAESLIGIVQGRLWLTNIQSLNDYTEFDHGLEIITEEAKELRAQLTKVPRSVPVSTGGTMDTGRVLAEFETLLQFMDARTDYRLNPRNKLFVASMTSKPNDLSQWQAYCPRSGGYSICFDAAVMEGPEEIGPFLRKCTYEESEKRGHARQILKAWMTKFVEGISRPFSSIDDAGQWQKQVSSDSYLELLLLAASFKDAAFAAESETRLIAYRDNPETCRFGSGAGFVRPRIELELHQKAITEVWIGPTMDGRRAKAGLQLLLQSKMVNAQGEIHEVAIKESGIPFRP